MDLEDDMQTICLEGVQKEADLIPGTPLSSACNTSISACIYKIRTSKKSVLAVCSLALFIDMVIYGVPLPIFPTILRAVGVESEDSKFYCDVLFSVYAVGLLLVTPILGILSDHYQNRQVPMLLGLIGLALSTILFPFAKNLTWLFIARFFQGVAAASSWVIGMAMIADVYPPNKLGFAMGVVNGVYTIGFMSGPVLGSVFTSIFHSHRAPFFICAALAFLDFMGRIFIKPKRKPAAARATPIVTSSAVVASLPPDEMGIFGKIKAFLGFFRQSDFMSLFFTPEIFIICIAVILGACSFTIVEASVASHVQSPSTFNMTENETTLVFLVILVPSFITSFIVGYISDLMPRSRLIFLGLVLHSFAPPLMIYCKTLHAFYLASIYFGISSSILSTPAQPEMAYILSHKGKQASFARIYAVFNICYSLGMVVGPFASAFLTSYLKSFLYSQCVLSIAFFIFSPIFLFSSLRLERKAANLPSDWRTVFLSTPKDFFVPVKLPPLPIATSHLNP
jgi:MFS transporter, DHA1 family, solute carrier family 18 (vesicular amine transporter), member 1/2